MSSYRLDNDVIIFPNGVEKHPYSLDFDFLDTLSLEENENGHTAVIEFVGLEELGLSYSSATKQVKGIPKTEGQHELLLRLWTDFRPDSTPREWKVRFLINGDPRSKWRDLPTPPDIEYPTPNTSSQTCAWHSPRKMLAVSVRGRSHAHEGKPRDDAFQLGYITKKDIYFLAVADGAGSGEFSRKGAALACATVFKACETFLLATRELKLRCADLDWVKKLLTEALCKGVAAAYAAICDEAKAHGRAPRDYATTLEVALCKRVGDNYLFVTWWVGDGALALYDAEAREVFLLGTPDHGDYEGQTRFLTMPEIGGQPDVIEQRIRRAVVEDFTALFLMTDGVSDAKFDSDAELSDPNAWARLLRDLAGENEERVEVTFDDPKVATRNLERWLAFWAKGSHDDRTLAMLW